MFPNRAGKKRRCALENPEPSSPKVTCIGQVRVKTKKHGTKLRTLSVGTGDVGNLQQKINQSWVHFPLTICGADFSRLFPGRSSSSSSSTFSGGENSGDDRNRQTSSCMAVFERWFVRIEGGKGRRRCEKPDVNAQPLEEGRASICITPPKNALLMMRYRSDPVKVAALSSRLFENPVRVPEADDEEAENGIHQDDDNGHSSQANTNLERHGDDRSIQDEERRKSHDLSLLFSSVDSNLEGKQSQKLAGDSSSSPLPDCLLLMICEPKLSMEVSKETWVCSTDFDRRLPRPAEERPEQKKRVSNIPPLPPLSNGSVLQPSRSSCTLPEAAAMSMAAMIEQKLVSAVAYEPFVLSRCKSVPMKTVFF